MPELPEKALNTSPMASRSTSLSRHMAMNRPMTSPTGPVRPVNSRPMIGRCERSGPSAPMTRPAIGAKADPSVLTPSLIEEKMPARSTPSIADARFSKNPEMTGATPSIASETSGVRTRSCSMIAPMTGFMPSNTGPSSAAPSRPMPARRLARIPSKVPPISSAIWPISEDIAALRSSKDTLPSETISRAASAVIPK